MNPIKNIFVKHFDDNGVRTLGLMFDEKTFFALTMERPWKNNQPDVSRIPNGEYTAKLVYSQHFEMNVWQLQDVPGRTFVEIHPANAVTQLEGCVAVGHALDLEASCNTLQESRDAFNELMKRTEGLEEIKVIVQDL